MHDWEFIEATEEEAFWLGVNGLPLNPETYLIDSAHQRIIKELRAHSMEVIEIPGYTLEEKLQIAKRYLVPRQLDAHGLTRQMLFFSAAALRHIIAGYTREAGVRNLEREIANVCRGCARK